MSQATRLAWYQTTNSTFTSRKFSFIKIIVSDVNLEISRYQDLALHNNRLFASGMSLILVTNVGRNDDKRPYLSNRLIIGIAMLSVQVRLS